MAGLRRRVSPACVDRLRSAAARAGGTATSALERADFFSLSRKPHKTAAPDARAYTIAVDDGGKCRTVTVTEPIADDALRDLVAELRAHADAQRVQR
jgi:hypothetical protein